MSTVLRLCLTLLCLTPGLVLLSGCGGSLGDVKDKKPAIEGDKSLVGDDGKKTETPKGVEEPRKEDFLPTVAKKTPEEERIEKLTVGLKSSTPAERTEALAGLAKAGAAGKSAARQLCELALNPDKKISEEALDTLEKVHPALYRQALRLLGDEAKQHRDAYADIAKMERDGSGAAPLVVAAVQRAKRIDASLAQQLTLEGIDALLKSAPDDPAALPLFITLTRYEDEDKKADLTVRAKALKALAVAAPHAAAPAEAVKTLAAAVGDADLRGVAVEALGEVGANCPRERPVIVGALTAALEHKDSRRAAAVALPRCRAQAAAALEKLKTLRRDPSEEVRDAVVVAMKEIERQAAVDGELKLVGIQEANVGMDIYQAAFDLMAKDVDIAIGRAGLTKLPLDSRSLALATALARYNGKEQRAGAEVRKAALTALIGWGHAEAKLRPRLLPIVTPALKDADNAGLAARALGDWALQSSKFAAEAGPVLAAAAGEAKASADLIQALMYCGKAEAKLRPGLIPLLAARLKDRVSGEDVTWTLGEWAVSDAKLANVIAPILAEAAAEPMAPAALFYALARCGAEGQRQLKTKGVPVEPFKAALLKLLASGASAGARAQAVQGLIELGDPNTAVLQAWMKALGDSERQVNLAAAQALERVAAHSFPQVREIAKRWSMHGDAEVKQTLARVLEKHSVCAESKLALQISLFMHPKTSADEEKIDYKDMRSLLNTDKQVHLAISQVNKDKQFSGDFMKKLHTYLGSDVETMHALGRARGPEAGDIVGPPLAKWCRRLSEFRDFQRDKAMDESVQVLVQVAPGGGPEVRDALDYLSKMTPASFQAGGVPYRKSTIAAAKTALLKYK